MNDFEAWSPSSPAAVLRVDGGMSGLRQ